MQISDHDDLFSDDGDIVEEARIVDEDARREAGGRCSSRQWRSSRQRQCVIGELWHSWEVVQRLGQRGERIWAWLAFAKSIVQQATINPRICDSYACCYKKEKTG